MLRGINFILSLIAYTIGLGSLVLFMVFVGGWDFLPWQIDAQPTGPIGQVLLINLGLVALFGIQHSVMARPGFKKVLTKFVPKSLERSCYCVATGVAIGLMCIYWQPMAGVVWHFDNTVLRVALTGLQLFGWGIVVASSFMINHFELFGVKQTYDRLIDRPEEKPTFVVKYMYRFVRHPLQMGMLIGIWATPHMSASHMFLSAAMTAYITIGLYLEERDLSATLGRDYEEYRQRVPMIVPKLRGLSTELITHPLPTNPQSLAATPFPSSQDKS